MQGAVLTGILINAAVAIAAVRARALTTWGGLAMGGMGFWIYLSLGWRGYLIPVVFFVLGSLFTRLGYERKRSRRMAEAHGGARGMREVLANGLVPLVFTVPIILVDARLFTLGFVGAWATALCDTAGTEIGGIFGKRCITLKNLHAAPPGTPGAVSLEGTAAGFIAAFILALAAAGLQLVAINMVILLAIAAFIGSICESGLADSIPATFPGRHELLNFLNTAVGGGLAVLWGVIRIGAP